MANELYIYSTNGVIFEPITEDAITWETERFGSPGKLSFTILKDDLISFNEGAYCTFTADGKNLFKGRIVTKERDKEQHISCVAYDQLQYLTNKDTYVYDNKTVNELISIIGRDFNLNVGDLVNTGYKLSRTEDNSSLWDIIGNAIDDTLVATGNMYVMYDDFGQIRLRNIQDMRVDYLLDKDTAINFNYSTSIIEDTYNRIKLVYDNDTAGTRDVYIAQDSDNIDAWGLLQYYETLKDPDIGRDKVNALLSLKNRKTRKLTGEALGDVNVRAGCYFPIHLNLGDIIANQYLIVEKVTHTFNENDHRMSLSVSGGGGFSV